MVWVSLVLFFNYQAYNIDPVLFLPDSLEQKVKSANHVDHLNDLNKQAKLLVYNDPVMAYTLCHEIIQKSNSLKEATACAKAHDIIGIYFQNKGVYDSAEIYYQRALDIKSKLKQPKLLAESFNNFGVLNRRKGNFNLALSYYEKALSIATKQHDSILIGNYNNNIGLVLENQGKLDGALEHHLVSLSIREKIGIEHWIAGSLNNLGIVYQRTEDYRLSLDYLQRALALKKKLDNRRSLASTHLNLGNSFSYLNQYDSAFHHYESALSIAEELDDKTEIASILNDMAFTAMKRKDFDEAINLCNTSIQINRSLGNRTKLIESMDYLVSTYLEAGQYKAAKEIGIEAYEIALKTKEAENIRRSAKGLAETFEKTNEDEKALKYFKIYSQYRDSLLNEEKLQSIAQAKEKYESDKKDQEIVLLLKESELQEALISQRSTQRNLLLGSLISVALVAFLMIRNYRVKVRSRDEINRKNKEIESVRSRFFANISHEFRTPLTLIAGPIQGLLEREKLDSNDLEKLKMVERNTQRLRRLINQLLDLSKIEDGRLEVHKEEKELSWFIQTLVSSFGSLAEQKQINYRYEIMPPGVFALIDSDKLEKIVYNLLSNAFKFTPKGGTVEFKASFKSEKSEVELQVNDTGSGMTEEQKDHVFDRFYQTEESIKNEVEGTGIGLALTKELVDFLGGVITVRSEKGRGSTFIVTLPIEITDSRNDLIPKDNIVTEPHQLEPALEAEDLKKLHPHENQVLLVEDNYDLRIYLKNCLGGNYNYIEAEDGKQGLKLAVENIPDIIISDLMMPEMDGIEFCERVKNIEETGHIPFIMLTAKAGYENKLTGLKTGADDYLTKPFDKDELRLKVSNALKKRGKLQKKLKLELLNEPKHKDVFSHEERFLFKLKSVINTHLGNSDFSVDFLSKEIGLSRVQLYRKVQALTNLSVSEFIRSIRLHKAKTLLERKWGNVSDIAYEVGYNNLSYFSKSFKETYGKSPSEWLEDFQKA
ncbi:MAG: tetratricopeptide repeat protein [Bacteroidota bacterium]